MVNLGKTWRVHVYQTFKVLHQLPELKNTAQTLLWLIQFRCKFLSRLYKALVIHVPILEYAVPLWSPYLQKNIDSLERVQRRASKYALPMSSRDFPYEERLAMLGWSSLQSRRTYLSLLECYKTIHGLNGLNCNGYFEFNCYRKTRSNHSFKLKWPLARVNCFLHSFFVRIIKQWNALPKEIVYEQDFSIFRSKLR